MRAGIVAPVGQLVARLRELNGLLVLCALRGLRGLLRQRHRRLGILRLCPGRLGSCRRIAPAGEEHARFGHADPIAQRPVALCLLRLPPERGDLAVEPGHQVLEPGEIGFGLAQLALGIAPAHMQSGDARRFLEHRASLGRLGGDHLCDLALAHQCRRMSAGRGVGEGQRHVLGAHVPAVDAIGAARAALDPSSDHQFFARIVGGVQHHLGEVTRRARGGAGEDDILHPARAHRLGRILAHHPADRLENVGLAAPVGPDDTGKARLDVQFGRLDEALEPRDAQLADQHRRSPLKRAQAAKFSALRPAATPRRLRASWSCRACCR